MVSGRREDLKKHFFPDNNDAWTGEEAGWFKIPRTLPLIFALLKKDIRGREDLSAVYLELLSHHYGGGLIELRHESEHAYASGFSSGRIRSWRERMEKLEDLGFIKTVGTGNQKYKYVLLLHPTTAIQNLRKSGVVADEWWNSYRARKTDTKELTFEEREAERKRAERKAAKKNRNKSKP